MKNLDQLLEYVQRELNTKRFLSESLEFLESLRSIGVEAKEATAARDKAVKDKEAAEFALAGVNMQVAAAQAQITEANEKAKDIVAAATAKAGDILASANAEAVKLMDAAEAAEQVIKANITAAEKEQKEIITENKKLAKQTANLQDALDALRKKLA